LTGRQKRELLILLVVIVLAVGAGKLAGHYLRRAEHPAEPGNRPRVAARLDGMDIPAGTLDKYYRASLWLHGLTEQSVPEEMRKLLRQNALNQVIRDRLLARGAEAEGVTVTEDELEQIIGEEFRSQFASNEEFAAALRQDVGLAVDDLKEMVRSLRLAQKMEELLMPGITVSESEIAQEHAYYAELLQHHPGGEVSPPARAELEQFIRARKAREELNRWIDGLLAEAAVEVLDPELEVPGPAFSTVRSGQGSGGSGAGDAAADAGS